MKLRFVLVNGFSPLQASIVIIVLKDIACARMMVHILSILFGVSLLWWYSLILIIAWLIILSLISWRSIQARPGYGVL